MDASFQAPLTPEQLAAVHAGGGFARMEDPATQRVYFVIEQSKQPTIDDGYIRDKIDEAYTDGEFRPLDMVAIKSEFQRRQALKNRSRE